MKIQSRRQEQPRINKSEQSKIQTCGSPVALEAGHPFIAGFARFGPSPHLAVLNGYIGQVNLGTGAEPRGTARLSVRAARIDSNGQQL